MMMMMMITTMTVRMAAGLSRPVWPLCRRAYNLPSSASSRNRATRRCTASRSSCGGAQVEGGKHHFSLFKPDAVLSQFVHNGFKKQRQRMLGAVFDGFPEGTMPIGRLDEMTEGLLLLTTDGKLSYRVLKDKPVEKEYFALVRGEMSDDECAALERGVKIRVAGREGQYETRPCRVVRLNESPSLPPRERRVHNSHKRLDGSFVEIPTTWISVVLTEGKNRQVRKMTAAVGFPVLRLVRVRIGHIDIWGNDGPQGATTMQPGEVRVLGEAQIAPFWDDDHRRSPGESPLEGHAARFPLGR